MNKKMLSKVFYLTKKVHSFFDEKLGIVASSLNLSMPEAHVLLFLSNNPECNHACDAVLKRGLSKAYVSKAITSLIEKDYIEYKIDESDKRYQHIVLKETVKDKVKILQMEQVKLINALKANITKDEFNTCINVIDKIYDNFIYLETGGKNV